MSPQTRALAWEEYFIYSAEFLPLAAASSVNLALASSVFSNFEIKIAKDSDFKLYGITYRSTDSRIRMRLRDDAFGRYLQKGAPDLRALAGRPYTGDYSMVGAYNDFIPYILPIPYRLSAATTLTVEASDFSAVSNTTRISFHGSKVRQGAPPYAKNYRYRIPYTYEIDLGTISASTAVVGVLSTDTDSDFLVEDITGVRTDEATILISEGARGRDWMDRATHFDNVAGRGMFQNNLPKKMPRFITRGGNISITVTDVSAASNTVRVYFTGVKLYG